MSVSNYWEDRLVLGWSVACSTWLWSASAEPCRDKFAFNDFTSSEIWLPFLSSVSPHIHRWSRSANQVEDEPICEYFLWAEVKTGTFSSAWPWVWGMAIAPKSFALTDAEGSWLWLQFAICSFPTPGTRSWGAGSLAELVDVGRGLWLSCLPATMLCPANPYVSECL